ncbi:hypothetical protein MJO28_014311 [Puccinia striiformis f. sp. tritici]|uniref:Uncharacterized protein n=1 Tax=Puccinia striiformis f. sp. tritici TaxID=168172 RepID=A0ACC0DTJ6_9BASI|nr:hypothetical protein MJO28_014311 [Puccinia striiformis f. sp. tritici]
MSPPSGCAHLILSPIPLTSSASKMSMQDIIFRDSDDSTMNFPDDFGQEDSSPSHNSPQHLNEVDHGALFGRDRNDDDLQINSSNLEDDNNIDRVCEDLQLKLKLDPAYLEIALHTAKCNPAARHANLIFANAAFQQIAAASAASASAQHKYDKCFDDLIRLKSRVICLIPNLEAYSNDPNKNGALRSSLFYLTLDAVDRQSAEWKEEHLAPNQMDENFEGLDHYRTTVGALLKYLLTNVLETARIRIKGNVPHRNELMAILYADLPPQNEKMTKAQIQDQIKKNASQWADIDERLRVLRGSTPAFQQMHATLILAKDTELFSRGRHIKKIITDEDVSVPSLDDVRAAMAAEATAAMAAESAAAMAAESTAP